jgi:hypothetical protein
MRTSEVWMRSSREWMRFSRLWMRSRRVMNEIWPGLWMRSSRSLVDEIQPSCGDIAEFVDEGDLV